jgi:alkanesulfonate monooxygenase SsuD/methylene tetrahydromethanopterin reductase-like flavin-dependent oxidoreductase (luciferase family)
MQLGFLADLRNPPPWERPWPRVYGRMLELIEEADRLGAGCIYLGEHHFAPDGYIPQPLLFAAAIAARTTNVRVGTEVLIASVRHPVHLAEEVAVLDVLSDGRVDLGLGAGYVPGEFEAFGVDRDARFRILDETAAEVRRLLAEVVTPRPVQDEVPIWLGYNFPVGARRAGKLGCRLMSLLPWCLEPYLEGLDAGGWDRDRARMGGLVDLLVAEDPERARARLQPHIEYQAGAYAEFFHQVDVAAGREPGSSPLGGSASVDSYQVLTPADAVALIRERTQGLPVEFVTPWLTVGGMPDDLAQEHIALTLTEVAPALA